MKFKKRHLVLASLILALAVAVYLNWQFSGTSLDALSASKQLGAATYVNSNTATADEQTALVSNQNTDYFATARVERDKAFDKAVDTAKETLKLADSSEDLKKQATTKLALLSDTVIAQTSIENVLIAKGYSQCLCTISQSSCTVALLKDEIDKNTPIIVKDCVTANYEIDFNNITILEI